MMGMGVAEAIAGQTVICASLGLEDTGIVVCGLPLDDEERSAPEPGIRTERLPARDATTSLGFEADKAGER
jgi:hypothetical protein